MRKTILFAFIILALLMPRAVAAQTSGPVYIVQEGDTLWSIASRFSVSLDALMAANGLTNGNLQVGQQLVIPGLEGLTGILDTEVVGFGDSLRGLARRRARPHLKRVPRRPGHRVKQTAVEGWITRGLRPRVRSFLTPHPP